MTWALGLVISAVLAAGAVLAQAQKVDPRDTAAIDACIKEARSKSRHAETCIGTVADPCVAEPAGQSTAGAAACYNRELLVWDDMLNGAYEQLRKGLAAPKSAKLQSAQRAWLEARKQGCEFYWEFFRGTIASPMAGSCYMRETANRAIYLRFFVEEVKK